MTYAQISKADQRKNKFLAICPEYPPISQAPATICAVPGFFDCKSGEERDKFEREWLHREAEKYYKALDGAGNVWKVRNPALARHPWLIDATKPIKYAPREFLGNIDDMSPTNHKELKW